MTKKEVKDMTRNYKENLNLIGELIRTEHSSKMIHKGDPHLLG